jgi:iron complex outermembrane receptor protein
MTKARYSFRQALLRAGACALAASMLPAGLAHADNSPAQVNLGLGQAAATQSESVIVKAQTRLLKEKNSPSAVTELGAKQIAANGIGGSPASLLRQAPSVYVYQQGLGDNAPELTIRGVRGLEVATTLDGIPTQDLLAPGSFYLANNLGGVFTTNQISSVSIYPGVAYPDKSTFGTIGGTIAYDSKRPTNDFYFDVTGSVGSFGTYAEGFEFNSGAYDSPLGTGDNAAKVLLNYRNFQTQGFIDGTPNRENEMEFAFDKPYNDGLSKFQATVIYNTANGLIENEPVPVPYLNQNGLFSNYPTSETFAQQQNDFFTVILKNDTYVNDYLSLGLSAFYIGNDNQLETYGDPLLNLPGGVAGPLTVGGSSPFINNPAGFGEGGLYGPPVGGGGLGIFGGGYGGYFYGGGNRYNPAQYYNNPKACPPSLIAIYGGTAGDTPCGLNDQINGSHSDTYGIQPRATVILPDMFGIANTIKFGGLIAKETSPAGYGYLGAFPQSEGPNNVAGVRTGGTQRTIYSTYVQDKIDAFEDTLHVTPGVTIEGTASSFLSDYAFGSKLAPAYGPNGLFSGEGAADVIDQYGYYKANKWDREYLPFANISYDFDKILPPLKGTSLYASFGNSALFAPVGDFGPNTAGPPPSASLVHMYEVGVKYNVSNLVLSADYFYQKVDRDFGFFEFQSGPQNGQTEYSGFGQREFKGFEANATWQVTPSIQLFGNVSHLLAKYLTSGFAFDTVAEDQYGIELKGNPVSGVPDWLSTFGVDYTKNSTFMDNDIIHVRVTGQYTGHQYTTFDYTGNDWLNTQINFSQLLPINNYAGCPGTPGNAGSTGCSAYTRYNQITGATVTDTKGGGISPFAIFNLDANYTLPTPYLPIVKKVTFDTNVQNIFNQHYFQYFYKQVSPASCGTFTSGPFVGLAKNNYSCSPEFADGIPGQPFGVYFTVTARF